MGESGRQTHEFAPIYDERSKIMILGTFPSVKSRENHFYYGHPRNRFWKVLAALYGKETPETVPEKKAFLLENGIAVWDVIASCDITGSDDSSIRNVVPADIGRVLADSKIERIYTNGATAQRLYQKYILPKVHRESILLPSTSPANAGYSLERLIESWRIIREM